MEASPDGIVDHSRRELLDFDCTIVPHLGPLAKRVDLEVANLKEATEIIVRHHYLHRGRTMAQLPYWIKVDNFRVGVMLFALPRLSETFCGYGPMELLELARLWLLPQIQNQTVVDTGGHKHAFSLGSCAIAKALRQCRNDWQTKYPRLPPIRAVVTWADLERHEGTVYKAANFREVGISGGSLHGNAIRRNGGRDKLNPDYLHKKRAYLFSFAR